MLFETGAQAHDLAIEVTETSLIKDPKTTASSLEELRAAGLTILLDDFATGYFSLSHIQMFPIDALKIDRSFISHLDTKPDNRVIVHAITAMARALELDVVAEGVENAEESAEALALGWESAQGCHFARPSPADEIEAIISAASDAHDLLEHLPAGR